MSLHAMPTTEQVFAVPANDEAPAAHRDHCAHVATYQRNGERQRLAELRDEYVRMASNGRFHDAASREWRAIPLLWRQVLVMLAGAGSDTDSLESLAARDWREMPVPERDALRLMVRSAKKHLGQLSALAARV